MSLLYTKLAGNDDNQSDSSGFILYENEYNANLWLLASKGSEHIASDEFCDNLIDLINEFDDDEFTDRIIDFVSTIKSHNCLELHIQLDKLVGDFEHENALKQIKEDVKERNFTNVFGKKVEKELLVVTNSEKKDHFKEYKKSYRREYRSVTKILIIINVLFFVFDIIFGAKLIQFIKPHSSLSNIDTWLSIILAGFTHFSLIHIFVNMVFLSNVGPVLEHLIGSKRFSILYGFCLVFSGIVVTIFGKGITAGASGALFGIFTFYVCLVIKYGSNKAQTQNIIYTFLLNVGITVFVSGISIAGHFGGIVAGLIAFLYFSLNKSKNNN